MLFRSVPGLSVGELVKRAVDIRLEVLAIALLDDAPVGHDIDEILRVDWGEVVGDDDGRLVHAPKLDSFGDEEARRRVESRSSFVCGGEQGQFINKREEERTHRG